VEATTVETAAVETAAMKAAKTLSRSGRRGRGDAQCKSESGNASHGRFTEKSVHCFAPLLRRSSNLAQTVAFGV
jgi:hypothetical protein